MKKIICDYCQAEIKTTKDGAVIWHEKHADGKWDFPMVIHQFCNFRFTRLLNGASHRFMPLDYAIHPAVMENFQDLLGEAEYESLRDRIWLTEKYH